MDTLDIQTLLEEKIRDLLHVSIRAHNIRDDDAVSIRTLKLLLVGKILESYGLDWTRLLAHHKTHTPVHPEWVKELQCDEEVGNLLAQVFVRNDKLLRIVKTGKNVNQILAVDGLGGPYGLNFDQKHYIGNMRFGSGNDSFYEKGPDYKRLHVQTVRRMYAMLGEEVSVPEKQIYDILRRCFEEMGKTKFPKIEFEPHEQMDEQLQGEVGRFYMSAMGEENIRNLIKSTGLKKFRGEKRTQTDREQEGGEPEKQSVE